MRFFKIIKYNLKVNLIFKFLIIFFQFKKTGIYFGKLKKKFQVKTKWNLQRRLQGRHIREVST